MLLKFDRNRTSTIIVTYSLYLHFLGLSLRNTSKVLKPFSDSKKSYVSARSRFKDLVLLIFTKEKKYLH
ncbi:MAG: hypothetical protein ACPKQO_10465 [Nitrososphaeraceae archaeon]